MTRKDQKRIIREMLDGMRDSLMRTVDAGKIPESWDGYELRYLLRDKAALYAPPLGARRKQDYNNHVMVHNLL